MLCIIYIIIYIYISFEEAAAGDMGRLVFEGRFEDGKRTGVGRLYDFKEGEKRLKLLCNFEDDKIVTSKKDNIYAWARFDGPGKFFHGLLSQERKSTLRVRL